VKFRLLTAVSLFVALPGTLHAQNTPAGDQAGQDDSFRLGEIIVTGHVSDGISIDSSSIGQQTIAAFDRNSLDDAANLVPGVNASNSGGSRNERLLYVRGFDRFQTPLSIDGIRVYLPADNRLDYGRFLTPDIAQIQVAKGYASVLDGPGAMGGAVNLVTRKPTKELEVEGRGQLNMDGDLGYAGYMLFGLVGTRHDKWYAQASYTRNFQDHWNLPHSFVPTASEDGGARDFSRTEDWRLNAKVGFTPNATDEYSISYTRQEGSKNAPLSTVDPVSTQRNWTWPWWNIDSIYFLSTTAISDSVTFKTRVYRNGFDNLLSAFDDRTETTQTKPRAFNSYYEDVAWGGSAQVDIKLGAADTFSLAGHFRNDKHVEFQQSFPGGATEPPQTNLEDTWSIAAENSLALSPQVTLVLGASYDWRIMHKAEEYGTPPGGGASAIFSYPLRNSDAVNGQGRLNWTPDKDINLYLSVSARSRFPTIFERFSSRFGGAISNPDLQAERSTNYEIGGGKTFGAVKINGAVFYSHLNDVITNFPFIYQGQAVTQSRNLGRGDYSGGEISIDAALSATLSAGANYTYIHRVLRDPNTPNFEPTGVPTDKAFFYADWRPLKVVHVLPSLEVASNRWTVNTAGTLYYRTGAYTLANLSIDADVAPNVSIGVGVRNAFDTLYQLVDGFPEPGRSVFLRASAKY